MSEIQGKPVYGTCECKEKVQVLSVDQATDLIQQMASNDWQVPADYIPKTSVNGIIEQHNKDEVKFWRGTTAEYDALTDEEKATYTPILTDDAKYQEIERILNNYGQSIENINNNITKMLNGDLVVGQASNTKTINDIEITKDANGVLKIGDIIIPQKILLSDEEINLSGAGTNGSSTDRGTRLSTTIELDEEIEGKTLEIEYEMITDYASTISNVHRAHKFIKVKFDSCGSTSGAYGIRFEEFDSTGGGYITLSCGDDKKSLKINFQFNTCSTSLTNYATVSKIYKIIE